MHRPIHSSTSTPSSGRTGHRHTLVMGLAVVATLPVVALLLELWPRAPRGLVAAIASLPLATLLLVALAWRPTGGRP